MAATLNSYLGNLDRVPQYIDECKRLGIEILKPDINRSSEIFTVEYSDNNLENKKNTKTGKIRFGLGSIKNVGIAGLITLIIIVLIMIFFYKISGLISSICLITYTIIVFILFNLIDGVLTLTGIAALILGIGMAIDSSVITLEKIKEELGNGKSLKEAYKDGNKRSIVSLIDANITTFIAAIVLFILGESNVKGFATMLMITIIVTAFSMIILNRIIMKNIIESEYFAKKEKFLLGKIKKIKDKNYLSISKYNIGLICIIIAIGLITLLTTGLNLGIDFKGGSTITIKSEETIDSNEVKEILHSYELIEEEQISDKETYIKLKNTLQDNEIKALKLNFDELNYKSVISNIVKKDLTKNAIKSLIIASLAILVYISIRFTSRYAISSIIAILSDVLVTIAIFSILKLEINFIFVAGILTIIGYSINDTIVVFDMIRDKAKKIKNINEESITNIVKESISLSLKRNIITSITTLTAVIVLLLIGTSGVKEFNMTVFIGLTAGTFSSLFVAPYIWMKLEIYRLKNPKKQNEETKEKLIKGINS